MGCQSIAGLLPNIKFAGTRLYTRVERGSVRLKCLGQEHNMMSLARAWAQTAMKMSSACSFIFMQIKVIFIRKVSHLDSLWNRGTRELGNGLFRQVLCLSMGGTVASWLVHLSLDWAVWAQALARDIMLCSWPRHFSLTEPLSTRVYKRVPANLMLGSNPAMD